MSDIPSCTSMGSHRRALPVVLRVSDLREDDAGFRDDISTWLTGHRQTIDFGTQQVVGNWVVVEATIHVPCKYLNDTVRGAACRAHGYSAVLPEVPRAPVTPLWGADGTVTVFQDDRPQALALQPTAKPAHSLPTLDVNPCAGAPCRTADNTVGAACCRDLILDVVLPADDFEGEALLAARKAPYVCKVERADESVMECEVISACGYLGADAVSCTLHDLQRADGSPAKPSICSEWPDVTDKDSTWHPGCRLVGL